MKILHVAGEEKCGGIGCPRIYGLIRFGNMGVRSTIVLMKVGKSNKGTWHPRTDKVDKIARCGRDRGKSGRARPPKIKNVKITRGCGTVVERLS